MSPPRSDSPLGGSSRRPYVICHMVPSVDGRIVTDAWSLPRGLLSEYERTAASFGADAWIVGRISMEPYAGKAALPPSAGRVRIPRTDFVARSDAPSYAIAIDPGGKLRWESGSILEGGGKINGSFLAAGLIDELSLLVAPVADGGVGTPTLFDASEGRGPARHLKLLSVERRRGDLLWVRYGVRRGRR